jgi:hypothetical protein
MHSRVPSWRRIKHDFLHHFHKPRLDLLVWILVAKLAPTYYRKLDNLLIDTGRFRELPAWRKSFKSDWKRAAQAPISLPINPKYQPNPYKWVCTCPHFSTSRFLLCKHLVQSVHPVSPLFFLEAKRNRTWPFWSHPSLVPLEPATSNQLQGLGVGSVVAGPTVVVQKWGEDEVDDSDGESDGALVDTGRGSGRLTLQERYQDVIRTLRDFCDGLDYQIQFNDPRMLETVEREAGSCLRLATSCLSQEHRLNSVRTTIPSTWEKTTTGAMFYRSRPALADVGT